MQQQLLSVVGLRENVLTLYYATCAAGLDGLSGLFSHSHEEKGLNVN